MEFSKFLNILKKHKYGIILIPLLVMLITWFLVRKLPDSYYSKGRMAAGITDESLKLIKDKDLQDSRINMTFSNLIQTMQSKVVYDQVSYKLILQQLTSPTPLRKPSPLFCDLNPSARAHAIEVYTRLYNERRPLDLMDKDQEGLNRVLISMGYDYESLKNNVRVYRVESSDFIDVDYGSEDPQLSAFVINTLCDEFIKYDLSITNGNDIKAIEFLSDLLAKKKDTLNMKMEKLKNYKIENRVINLNEETRNLYGQLTNYQTQLSDVEKQIEAYEGAIRGINAKFDEHEKQYVEGRLAVVNKDILVTQNQLNALNDEYIKNNFDPAIKSKITALKETLAQKINQSTDKYVTNPLLTKDNLVSQKLKLEVDQSFAKNSIVSLKAAIADLNKRLSELAPNEAVIQSYESDIGIATQEYMEILRRYNQSNLELKSSVKIKLVESALPGIRYPSKKLILLGLSGFASFAIYLVILFALFYLDESIKVASDLFNRTDMAVLGYLPVINSSFLDVQKLWDSAPEDQEMKQIGQDAGTEIQKYRGSDSAERPLANEVNDEFKKMIRSTRFEINMALMGGRNLVITSMDAEEGKTLVALSLVSAYQMMNKKVLLIDGNFANPGITELTQPKFYIEDYLVGNTSAFEFAETGNVSVLGNYGNDVSLFEINSEDEIQQKLLELKDIFDIVIIEAPGLSALNHSKEWIVVSDRVACVFEANTSISGKMKEKISYLKELDGKFIGWVLNKVTNN